MRHRICLYVEILTLFLDLSLCISFNENKVAFSGSKTIEGKIVGGKSIQIEQVPSAVLFFNYGAMCGGTILNSWSVVTAAHCVDHNKDPDDMSLHTRSRYAFDKDAEIYKVSRFVVHPEYNKTVPFACDIAVLFVSKPINFGAKAQKALIANHGKWMNAKEKHFHVTGWGWTTYGGPTSKLGLMMTHLRFVPLDKCASLHKIKLTPDMFCLYGDAVRDTCKGDSGSGVHWKRYLVGIVSHGDGCSEKNKPSMYSNVWFFRSWLRETIQKHFRKYCTTESSEPKSSKKKRLTIKNKT